MLVAVALPLVVGGLVRHERLGGQHERRDGRGVLQSGARDLRRVDDALGDHVDVVAGRGVEAVTDRQVADLLHDDATLETTVDGDLLERGLQRELHGVGAGRLVTREVELVEDGRGLEQSHATTGDDALLDGRLGVAHGVLDAVLALLELDLGGRADLDDGHAAGKLGEALLELLAVVVGVGLVDLGADLVDPALDLALVAGTLDDGGLVLRDDDLAGLAEQLEEELTVRLREAAVDALVEASRVETVEPLVERRTAELWTGIARSLQRRGVSAETYLTMTGQSAEEVVGRLRAEAERSLKRELVLDAVATKLGIEVADEEIDELIREQTPEGGEPEEAERVTKPLRELAEPVLDLSHPELFTEVQGAFDPFFPVGRRYYWKSEYLASIEPALLEGYMAHAARIPSPHAGLILFQLGGALGERAPDHSPVGNRDAQYVLNIGGAWERAEDDAENVAWARATHEGLRAFSTGGTYVNFLTEEEGRDRIAAAYSAADLERLAAIKRKFDPDNLFRHTKPIAG